MNKRGQSIIEYALIAVLVILGIVVMGPYVLRSVGAHFKLWDEGVQDSFTENLTQAPVNNVPFINATCNCSYQPGSCGSSQSGSTCAANQRIYNLVCSIGSVQGCSSEPATTCQPDNSCCTNWVSNGCGTVPLGQPPITTNCNNVQCNCNYGYQIQSQECGLNNSIQCVQDTQSAQNPQGCPPPTCLGILSPGALYCVNNSTTAPTNLLQNNGITYVGNDPSSCPANPTCQVYCTSPYILNATKTSCLYQYTVPPCVDNSNQSSNNGYCSDCTIPGRCQIDSNPPATPGSQPDFTIDANATITALSVKAVSGQTQPPTGYISAPGDGCQNPGEPSYQCQVSATY